jgi:hypothetical protein
VNPIKEAKLLQVGVRPCPELRLPLVFAGVFLTVQHQLPAGVPATMFLSYL